MHRRKILTSVITSALLLTAISSVAVSARESAPTSHQPVHVIRAVGQEDFETNALIFSTFRFDPGRSFPHQGERIRLTDDDASAAPHTLTLVRRADLPTTFDEVFECDACNEALGAHFATDPPIRRIGLADGLNAPGDSLLIFNGQSIGATVTAPPGSVLNFLCAFHPWMQGRLVVG